MCFDAVAANCCGSIADVYLGDVPPHQVGWASPVGDPATGNVCAFGVGGTLVYRQRKVVWELARRRLGLLTTHGGRRSLLGRWRPGDR